MSIVAKLLTSVNRAPVPLAPDVQITMPLTHRGGMVSQMRAIGSVGTLFAVVHRLSNATSSVDWHLYRRSSTGQDADRVEVTSHAALDLWRQPNPHLTRQAFVEAIQQHLDLTGEANWLVTTSGADGQGLPLELWPVRPDRIEPVPDPYEFVKGYIYVGPSGQRIPLAAAQIQRLMLPNPLDPYRGLGPVQSIMVDLDSSRYTAEWNRNFFANSAEPGGVIEFEDQLTDVEFDTFSRRWSEQHRGVSNAHRVAIIERGKWVERGRYSHHDMEFSELRSVSRDVIREAFGFPKHMLGVADDVNRANAEAGEYMFAKWLIVPRLERIKAALNTGLLPRYAGGRGLEFDYDSPVPDDEVAENVERTSKADAAQKYIAAGFSGESVVEALELPASLVWQGRADVTAPAHPHPPAVTGRVRRQRPRNATTPDDLAQVDSDWSDQLGQLAVDYAEVISDQRDQVSGQIQRAIDSRDTAALAALAVVTVGGATLITAAMIAMGATAAATMAATAPTEVEPVTGDAATTAAVAGAVASMLGQALATGAGREALRLLGTGTGAEIAQQVDELLAPTDGAVVPAVVREQLGGALTRAQNEARLATAGAAARAGHGMTLVASEVLDSATCGPCARIDGTVFADADEAARAYGAGPYVHCLGRSRCRGTVVAQWL